MANTYSPDQVAGAMRCIAETVLPDGGFRYKVASGPQGAISPDVSGVLRANSAVICGKNYGAGILINIPAPTICSGAHMSVSSLPVDFISEVRSALLSRSSVLASEIGVLVQDIGKRYELSLLLRDLGGAQAFVETHLADLFVKDPSPDSCGPKLRFLARPALPPAPSIPADREVESDHKTSVDSNARWWPADGHDRSFWDGFNNPLRNTRFALASDGTLYWTESAAPLLDGARTVEVMTADDYRNMAQHFANRADDAVARQRMQQILSKSPTRSFPTDWFRLVGLFGLRAAWESSRIESVIEAFRERMVAAGASQATADVYAAELSKSKNTVKRKPPSPTAVGPEVANEGDNTQNLRHLLIDLARTLSDDEIRELRIPLGKVVDLLTKRLHPRKPR